ncbi:MAG: NAD-dependent epimerase/dehydratase family protein [Armatimonadetes bacterium]|nr:NAD-dependent epimerase/dehydratase family protein [Armatimonadota bacterium]
MNVLVIGGTGNISTQIVRSLLVHGHAVTIVTRGKRPAPDGVRAVVADRKQRDAFETAMRAESPDAVIDMIAYEPADTESTLRAFAGRVGHLVHCSTVMTYGPPIAHVYADESCPLQARSGYGKNKIVIDELLLRAHADSALPVTIVKPSYTYGPGMPLLRQVGDDGRWIDRIRKGKPILSSGDGNGFFQMLPTRDAGEFFTLLLGREHTFGQIYNMVHPEPTTWDQWHRMAMQAVGREVEIVHAPAELLMATDQRYAGLDHNFGHHQLFSGAKAARDVPEWQATTDRVEWMRENIAYMDRQGLIVDTDADGDDLEDRLVAALCGLPASLAST